MFIVLAGAPRPVNAHEQEPLQRPDSSAQRRLRIDFEVPSCDHAVLGRELHLALDGAPLRDQHGIGWHAVSMSSLLASEGDVRQFTVDLVEV